MDSSGKPKRGPAGKKGAGPEKKPVSRFVKADLQFLVGRIGKYLKNGCYSKRVGAGAPIYLAAVLEYLAAEVMVVMTHEGVHQEFYGAKCIGSRRYLAPSFLQNYCVCHSDVVSHSCASIHPKIHL